MKTRLIYLFIFLILLLWPTFAFAQSTSDIDTQKRLLEVEKLATSSTKTASSSASKTTSLTFTQGLITSTANLVLFLQTPFGPKTTYTNDSTRFINLSASGKKLIGFGDVKVGETVFVLGTNEQMSSGVAKVIVRDSNPKQATFSLQGSLSEKTDTSLTLKNFNQPDLPTVKVNFDTDTVFKKTNQKIDATTLTPDDKLVIVGTLDSKGTPLAKEVLKLN